ncbi:MAG: ECF transporter S component [Anaerolineae bacterium]|nr:ECF transporter S component [Anaerolineae bacterium]
MRERYEPPPRYIFSTRDLLMMAALAALGGVTGTYINAIGDFLQSILGFAGTTQWAAGLHVLWLTLAMGLVGKTGAGTITGILKGMVELLSGNTHGILVLLVDIVAGLLVDIAFALFRHKDRWPAYVLAGGLASASNVFVFQLFAALPADILAFGAMALVGGIAALSGVVFAGILAWMLLNALRNAGVVKDNAPVPTPPRYRAIALSAGTVIVLLLYTYLRATLQGPPTIAIQGDVAAPYAFPAEHDDLASVTVEATLRDVTTRDTGIPLGELLARAEPRQDAALVLVEATDGYAFFITMEEVLDNDSLVLAVKGRGEDAAYDIVGAESSKAWVRNVSEMTVVGPSVLNVTGLVDAPAAYYDPADWQGEMDSTSVALRAGVMKLQGVPLGAILSQLDLDPAAKTVALHTSSGDPVTVPLSGVVDDDDVRIFTVIEETGITYAVARMNGEVLAEDVQSIEIW